MPRKKAPVPTPKHVSPFAKAERGLSERIVNMSDQYETLHAEFERLRADNARLESAFSDCAENAEAWHQKAERLRARNATLIETLKGARCPVDSRSLVGECQQCGCAAGILIRDEQKANDG